MISFASLLQKHKLFSVFKSQQYWIIFLAGNEKYFHQITKSISSANQFYLHWEEDGEILASVVALHEEDGITSYPL